MIAAEVLKAHLDALDMQMQLVLVQVKTLRHALEPLLAPKARPSLPARCEGQRPERCALQDDDAMIGRGTFTNPNAWQCVGCHFMEAGA